jgi:alpha-galactosidase
MATKIVFIGAGSMSFGVPTFKDIFTTQELKGSTLSLVDIDKENLERMYSLALVLNEASSMEMKIEKTTERRNVLSGAKFVINSLAIERCDLWKHDFNVPKQAGIRHCLGENGGPGALFFSMRTIPVIMDICKDMQELCPDAWFLNFSNPESRIILAVNKYTNIKCIGLCHGIFMAQHDVAKILGMEPDDVKVTAAGLNHFQWLLSIKNKDGDDLYPLLIEKEKTFDSSFEPFTRKIFKKFGYWPTCSDDHLGEYLPYGYEAGEHGYNFEDDEKSRVQMKKDIAEVLENKQDPKTWLKKSGEKAVEVITAIATNTRTFIPSAIVYNDGAISNLPDELAVEIPIVVDGDGVHKVHIGDVPPHISAILSLQIGAQQMAVNAAVNGSKEMAMQALMVDPVINSTLAAEVVIDKLWEINKQYIKSCML